jgi:hypothetical protein
MMSQDPHSPLASLLWSYFGWLFIENKDLNRVALYDRYARDMIRDRFYVFVERAFVWIVLLQWVVYYAAGVAAGLLLGWSLMESVQFGASVWLWGCRGADHRRLARHMVGQLRFPISGAIAITKPTTIAAIISWLRSSPAARDFTTTTMPTRTRPATAIAGGKSI